MESVSKSVEKKSGWGQKALFAAVIAALFCLGVYFRAYELFPREEVPESQRRAVAELRIRETLQKQILQQMAASGSQIPAEARKAFAERQAESLIQSDRDQFEQTVARFTAEMSGGGKVTRSHRYLLEADPYHYLAQVQMLLETGKIAEKVENRKFFDPLRVFPKGYWVPIGGHPYVGVAVYRFLEFFRPGIELMEALGFVPLVLLLAVILAFYGLSRSLGFGPLAFAAGGVSLVLAPIFLQRSSYGWFDTDPYNLLFPCLVLACFFSGYGGSTRKTVLSALAAGAFTGLYVLFWSGWPFIFLLVLGGSAVLFIFQRFTRDPALSGAGLFPAVYFVSAITGGILAAGPSGFFEFISIGAQYVAKFSASEPEAWPNVFLMVGETNAVTLQRLVYLTGNAVTYGFVAAGVLSGFVFWRLPRSRPVFIRWAVFLLMSLPLLFLSVRTERFALLFVLPTAVFAAFSIYLMELVVSMKADFIARLTQVPAKFQKILLGLLVGIVLLPMQLLFAHALAMKSEPIMNDVWYGAMKALREKTPENAVIYSWWPPGYFITAVARRSVFSDGGTQDFPEAYWLSRVFMANTEEEALGTMRMMNQSGNRAVEVLQSQGMKLSEAMDILNQILPLNRPEAENLLNTRLGAERSLEVLKETHGDNFEVPSYLFIYSEMVEKNLALSLFARWDFHKAALIQKVAGKQKKDRFSFLKPDKSASVDRFMASSGEVLRYRPESPLIRREGAKLFFNDGIVVDWEAKKAIMDLPNLKAPSEPYSFFYLEDGDLQEVKGSGNVLSISVLVYEEEGAFYSVIADRELLRSMLFRLYYLKGAGLRYFRPVFELAGEAEGMKVQIFETNWEAFKKADLKEEARV